MHDGTSDPENLYPTRYTFPLTRKPSILRTLVVYLLVFLTASYIFLWLWTAQQAIFGSCSPFEINYIKNDWISLGALRGVKGRKLSDVDLLHGFLSVVILPGSGRYRVGHVENMGRPKVCLRRQMA